MELTQEQKRIIDSEQDLIVNAVAGSGKTTTIIEYARKRHDKRILYLAYNKSVRQHAQKMFQSNRIGNVTVETAHSLAYKYVIPNSSFTIRNSYLPSELVTVLNIPVDNEEQLHLKMAYHVWHCYLFYCNHIAGTPAEAEYQRFIPDMSARSFVMQHYDSILHYVHSLLRLMEAGSIGITHDFYLKRFQLMQPRLPYDLIMFDEGQDASPVMLDVFFNQPGRKIIIGDTHQQIYGWRYAVNALEDERFARLALSRSFRFGNDIARLARSILSLKSLFMAAPNTRLTGVDSSRPIDSRAFIARTNAVLLSKAIDLAVHSHDYKQLYFEGGISSYIYTQSGTSLYDLINLHQGNRSAIKDPLVMSMPTFDDIIQYAALTGDVSLKVLANLVTRYGGSLAGHVERLRSLCVEHDSRATADITFTTVHKSKGMEYDEVFLGNDFVNEQQLLDRMPAVRGGVVSASALSEEVNMLYVAVTRTKAKLHIPAELVPVGLDTGRGHGVTTNMTFRAPGMSRGVADVWSKIDDVELKQLFVQGKPIRQIALLLNRSQVAISERIEKLRLWEKF